MKNQPEKKPEEKIEKVVLDPKDWQIIIDFLKSVPIPFTESARAATVLSAVNRAQLGSIIKIEETP